MVVLGLVLLALGALCILAVVLDVENTTIGLLGADVSALTLFLLGLGSGVAILWGLGMVRWGARRSLQRRREHKQLQELGDKLDRAEAESRRDDDDRS